MGKEVGTVIDSSALSHWQWPFLYGILYHEAEQIPLPFL
jgi:hypothetical protein